jgi:hypothetical protein
MSPRGPWERRRLSGRKASVPPPDLRWEDSTIGLDDGQMSGAQAASFAVSPVTGPQLFLDDPLKRLP